MKKSWIVLGVIIAIVAVLVMTFIGNYNGFVRGEEDVDKTWAQVENQLQRRMELIPNLVNTAKGYMEHEQDVMKSIADARANLAGAGTVEEKAQADSELTSALSRLLMVVENYPNLKADTQFTRLMDELAGTENRLAVARKDYNDQVAQFNKKVKTFPGAMIASMFGFEKRAYFEAAEGADVAPVVNFE